MASSPPRDAAWVRATIAPQLDGGAEAWRIDGPIFANRNGLLFKALRPGAPSALAIKVHHPGTTDCQAMQRHYANLVTYHDAMPAEAGLGVPRPVLLDAENDTMVMQWIDLPLMSKSLLAAGLNAAARRREFAKAGRWLAAFHACGDSLNEPFDSTAHLTTANRIAGEIPGPAQTGWAWRQLTMSLAALDAHKTEFDETPLVFGRRHGDYTPTNIFAGRDQIIGIDFLPTMRGPLITDICRFMAYADIYKYGWTLPKQMDHIAGPTADLTAFMIGYGDTDIVPPDRMMTWLQLAETTRRIAARTKAITHHGKTAWRLIELHRLSRRARHLAKRLEG